MVPNRFNCHKIEVLDKFCLAFRAARGSSLGVAGFSRFHILTHNEHAQLRLHNGAMRRYVVVITVAVIGSLRQSKHSFPARNQRCEKTCYILLPNAAHLNVVMLLGLLLLRTWIILGSRFQ